MRGGTTGCCCKIFGVLMTVVDVMFGFVFEVGTVLAVGGLFAD